jgi:hypothetical protein
VQIIDTLLYSLKDDALRGLLRNFYVRLFDECLDPDISWMVGSRLKWLKPNSKVFTDFDNQARE